MSESFVQLNRTPSYQSLIVENYLERKPATIAACDELAHIEDTDLYAVIRDNQFVYVTFNEVTDAERRAAEVVMNIPCDLGVY